MEQTTMKVFTKKVFQMTDKIGEYILLKATGYNYIGPVARAIRSRHQTDAPLPATTVPSGYTPHAAGGVAVTSNAATDLDTTAAALDTLRTEVAGISTNIIALRAILGL